MKGLDPSVRILPVPRFQRFSSGIPGENQEHLTDEDRSNLVRIFPHRADGEGHFAALLQKGEGSGNSSAALRTALRSIPGFTSLPEDAQTFLSQIEKAYPNGHYSLREGRLYLQPDTGVSLDGLRILRNGLYLGDCLKNRFEPSQTLSMTLSSETFSPFLSMDPESGDLKRYLRGEAPLSSEESQDNGWILACVSGFPLGFLKRSGGRLKNQLAPSWRMDL